MAKDKSTSSKPASETQPAQKKKTPRKPRKGGTPYSFIEKTIVDTLIVPLVRACIASHGDPKSLQQFHADFIADNPDCSASVGKFKDWLNTAGITMEKKFSVTGITEPPTSPEPPTDRPTMDEFPDTAPATRDPVPPSIAPGQREARGIPGDPLKTR